MGFLGIDRHRVASFFRSSRCHDALSACRPLLLPALQLSAGSAAADRQGRPNIIIVLADDLGVGDLGMNGSPIRTPHIDRLAKEGACLSDFYASANVCSPSRAGLLTGRYPIRMGLADDALGPESRLGLPAEETTLAELLAAGGYATALMCRHRIAK